MSEPFFGIQTIYGHGDYYDPYLTRIWIGRLRFHVFHRGDLDPDPHDHPWDFSTFPLTSYVEEVVDLSTKVVRRQIVPAWRWSYRPAEHTHRVLGPWTGNKHVPLVDVSDVGQGKIFTIIWRGKSTRRWGFLRNRDGNWYWTPWREYVFGGGKHAPCGPVYEPSKDSAGSYAAAIEAKRLRGDKAYPAPAGRKPDPQTARELAELKEALERKLREDGHG
ncbi:hypothetical protein [Mesorhizobium sp.]|uniref:hypothetical protein n=1 Tax=Mesorhizobium sp. TaxID=1871066 RepID=UPI0025C40BDD|nr:hypothetical protein [Mesorhizobium sp.]